LSLHFERGNLEAIRLINSGKIGKPRILTSVFSQRVKAGNSRLKKGIGGALYDMGAYCINTARFLFKAEPTAVFAWNSTAAAHKRFQEVPEITTGVLKFLDDRIAHFTTSFAAADRSVFEVIGTKGALKMDPAYEMAGALKSEITINGRTIEERFKKRDQFAAELVYFSDCILDNKQPESSGEEGLADVLIVRALLESLRRIGPWQSHRHESRDASTRLEKSRSNLSLGLHHW
jgi:predicted dehydrogenase